MINYIKKIKKIHFVIIFFFSIIYFLLLSFILINNKDTKPYLAIVKYSISQNPLFKNISSDLSNYINFSLDKNLPQLCNFSHNVKTSLIKPGYRYFEFRFNVLNDMDAIGIAKNIQNNLNKCLKKINENIFYDLSNTKFQIKFENISAVFKKLHEHLNTYENDDLELVILKTKILDDLNKINNFEHLYKVLNQFSIHENTIFTNIVDAEITYRKIFLTLKEIILGGILFYIMLIFFYFYFTNFFRFLLKKY